MRHPEYGMEDRLLLPAVDYEMGTVTIGGRAYPMLDINFPTIDPRNPLELTRGEKELLRVLSASFRHSEVLHRHVRFLYSHGSIYTCCNSNLLYHGCIPMRKDGTFEGLTFVITGSVEHFANRKELQELIESKGGKASGSVTSKTAYLINNDTTSNSSKNKKAKELGIPIISEKEFLNML